MARMKDTTPIAEGDIALARKETRRQDKGFIPKDGERVSLATEERMRKKRLRYEACEPVAAKILEEARNVLAVRFRFLDQALWKMPLIPSFDIYGISSDGRSVYFDPVYVVDRFKISFNEVVRDVIHCLFHCIFRHPFMLYSVLRQPWDVACDIAIEAMILDLVGDAFPSNMDRRAKEALKVLKAHVGGVITAERLYWFFGNEGNKTDLKSLAPMFFHDSHGLWYGDDSEDAKAEASGRREDGLPEESSRTGSPEKSLETEMVDGVAEGPVEVPMPDLDDASQGQDAGSGDADGPDADSADAQDTQSQDGLLEPDHDGLDAMQPLSAEEKEQLAQEWEDVAQRMEVELETSLAKRGDGAGSLVAGLKALSREVGDYAAFLRRFATLHETMRINDDEFDYIYYKFGLDTYGNMPLIEPLEYRDDKRIHDFVIAIDTSESCSGELVQAFMQKTYSILKASESFHDRVNIHIIQCDAQIQDDTRITTLDQLDAYLRDFQLRGFGGTDFRPVFDYVEVLKEKGEFTDLRGLLYFTDGEGVFPRRAPDYMAAFVFLDDGYTQPEVPPWALKCLISRNELEVVQDGRDPRR